MTAEIRARLFAARDEQYRQFQAKLTPGVDIERIIGVRTPVLRAMAAELAAAPGIEAFLRDLPHRYYDENNLHGYIISRCRDYDQTVAYVDALLPYVDNWATCDLLSPRVFRRSRPRLRGDIARWIASDATYTKRFGVGMIMSHFLDEDFDAGYLDTVAAIRSGEYYVNMMVAWFFATALAKQWEAALPYIEGRRLDGWTHNKAIRKAVESYRITGEQKAYLRTLKRPKGE